MSTLGSRLRDAREKNGWTQTYVCKKIGISNSTLSGYERDYREPDADMISTFAKIYEVPAGWLLTGKADDPSHTEKANPLEGISRAFFDYDSLPEDEKEYLEEELPDMVKFKLEEFRRMKERFMAQKKKEDK
jgi:transcriptional regulator with XRE-family HTH domain